MQVNDSGPGQPVKTRRHRLVHLPGCGPRILLGVLCLVLAGPAAGARRLDPGLWPHVQAFFPGAETVGPIEGEPPAAEVRGGGRLLGYVFLTDDVLPIPAYSGKPIRTLVGLGLDGRIRGLHIVHHEEPILVVGVSDAHLRAFLDQYPGKSIERRFKIGGAERPGTITFDGISGATITAMILNASIYRGARKVAAARGIPRPAATPGAGRPAPEPPPVWRHVWQQRWATITVLVAGLLLLTTMLVLQDWLVRRPRLLRRLRIMFLVYTLVFIGWYALAQLSVVNVFTFLHAVVHEFSWDTFMVEPLMFILWAYVAFAILLWGRGVYCGWLCPFGALQELAHRLGRRLRLPAWEPPEVVHERLWAVKYIVLLVLFAVSLHSMPTMQRLAEIEPFKTAITLRFQREWPFVVYAVLLVLVSVPIRKAFCRYLCPLGAALTFPSHFRIFDWLRRRKECGHPCRICERQCEVRAIRPTGEINHLECQYCLDCQVTYYDDRLCPPLVDRRRRRERARRPRPDPAPQASPGKAS